MIRDSILAELERRFPSEAYRVVDDEGKVAIFPAKCPEVGDLTIWDDEDEATVVIEHITHDHFNPYDDSLTEAERDEKIAEEVCDFLEALFRDEIILWKSESSGGTGYSRRDLDSDEEEPWVRDLQRDALYFVWSGPVEDD